MRVASVAKLKTFQWDGKVVLERNGRKKNHILQAFFCRGRKSYGRKNADGHNNEYLG